MMLKFHEVMESIYTEVHITFFDNGILPTSIASDLF